MHLRNVGSGPALIILLVLLLSSCRERTTLFYTVDHEEHVIHFTELPEWHSSWNHVLIDKLETGGLPAFNYDNRPLTPDSVRLNRLLPPSIFPEESGHTIAYGPDMIAGIITDEGRNEYIDLMFYDDDAQLFRFYCRIRIADLESAIGKSIEFREAAPERRT